MVGGRQQENEKMNSFMSSIMLGPHLFAEMQSGSRTRVEGLHYIQTDALQLRSHFCILKEGNMNMYID